MHLKIVRNLIMAVSAPMFTKLRRLSGTACSYPSAFRISPALAKQYGSTARTLITPVGKMPLQLSQISRNSYMPDNFCKGLPY